MLCARNYVKNLELCLQLGVLWGFYMLVFRPPRRSPQEAPGITVPLGLLGRYMRCLGFGPQALVIGACRAVQVEIFFFWGGGLEYDSRMELPICCIPTQRGDLA